MPQPLGIPFANNAKNEAQKSFIKHEQISLTVRGVSVLAFRLARAFSEYIYFIQLFIHLFIQLWLGSIVETPKCIPTSSCKLHRAKDRLVFWRQSPANEYTHKHSHTRLGVWFDRFVRA